MGEAALEMFLKRVLQSGDCDERVLGALVALKFKSSKISSAPQLGLSREHSLQHFSQGATGRSKLH